MKWWAEDPEGREKNELNHFSGSWVRVGYVWIGFRVGLRVGLLWLGLGMVGDSGVAIAEDGTLDR